MNTYINETGNEKISRKQKVSAKNKKQLPLRDAMDVINWEIWRVIAQTRMANSSVITVMYLVIFLKTVQR